MSGCAKDKAIERQIQEEIPVVPINDGVVFPYMLVPLMLKDSGLIRLIEEALAGNKIVGVFTQKDSDRDMPGPDDIYHTGCAMVVQKMAQFPDGHMRIIGQGLSRIRISYFTEEMPVMRARIQVLQEPEIEGDLGKAMIMSVSGAFTRLVESSESYPEELLNVIPGIRDAGKLADLIAANINMDIPRRQQALETLNPVERLGFVYENINDEIEIAAIGEKIRKDAHREMDREQRDYYLRQQIRSIQKELGEDDSSAELDELKDRIDCKAMPEHAREAAIREFNRLSRMGGNSSEYSVARTYLDWLLDLPWESGDPVEIDLEKARRTLDGDHFDLAEVKERLLEHLAVMKLNRGARGSIICLTGPPGVGKTSLGKSIAAAMGRAFVRVSLGGVRDEAEIRGHRRTYIGAMPGRIIQGIRTAGTCNPVFMLDEVDKLGADFRGDPSSALLEVLDPAQNNSFVDHYVNIPFDLSEVMFITTANVSETIPAPLLDRMEVIEIPGYITADKIEIASRFIVPRQMEENGIRKGRLKISDEAIRAIVEKYTREAGVRDLERKIASIARKTARKIVEGKRGPFSVAPRNLGSYLGEKDFPGDGMLEKSEVGVATGMAKTSTGGVILFIEALGIRGSGKVKLTGQLGDVMKESAEAAMSFVRSHYGAARGDEKFFDNLDIHLHIPAGAVPKDGPSAGIAIAAALASLASGRRVRRDIAMSGEITITGKVLPVGGVRDKVIAAHRAGIRRIILPEGNRRDLSGIPGEIREETEFIFVGRAGDGISAALDDDAGTKKPAGARKKIVGKR